MRQRIHPYRRDALSELERLAGRGACLIKWLPGAQNIRPDDPRCFTFYEAMAHLQIPLLCHTGNEHTLKAFPDELNDPRRLVPALERGVTVIAAHCGARLFLHEQCHLRHWRGWPSGMSVATGISARLAWSPESGPCAEC